jgi:hypothetical protein
LSTILKFALMPLVTRAESASRLVVAVDGCLRWLNTVALWVIALTVGGAPAPDDTRAALIGALTVVGLGLLMANVIHLASSLNETHEW